MGGKKITNAVMSDANGTSSEVANKNYVDSKVAGTVVNFPDIDLSINNLTTGFDLTLLDTASLIMHKFYECSARITPRTSPGFDGYLTWSFGKTGTNGTGTTEIPSTFFSHTGGLTINLRLDSENSGDALLKIKSSHLKNTNSITNIKCIERFTV